MSRAAGIHLVASYSEASVDILTGLIKANITSRIAFAVSPNDSAERSRSWWGRKTLGRGDMLYYPIGVPKPIRSTGAFVSEKTYQGPNILSDNKALYISNLLPKRMGMSLSRKRRNKNR